MLAKALEHAECAHLRSLYLIPLGLGANEFVVDHRVFVTSCGVTSAYWHISRGGRSSGCRARTSMGFMGKKWAQRRLSFSRRLSAREPSSCHKAGKMLFTWPFRTLAMCHMSAALSTLLSSLCAQVHFAF